MEINWPLVAAAVAFYLVYVVKHLQRQADDILSVFGDPPGEVPED